MTSLNGVAQHVLSLWLHISQILIVNNDLTLFHLFNQKVVLALNAVARFGLIKGSEMKIYDNTEEIIGTPLMCSYELELTPLNTLEEFPLICVISYQGRKK
jgi:hypothetical protein